ncbi:hypothetical protein ACQBAR_02965 [Propionibacteriaceae bacterium Y1685]|uniref:arsenate reductase/protein-tyrosine-phosphatase family protein n=1 Tax=Microlunatus sp. Y1700 TaxID=3418487 RepID=UPI003B82C0E1
MSALGGEPFRILTVCTGNVCRSPAAERLLAEALEPEFSLASAGTRALVDHAIAPPMRRLLEATASDRPGFRARQLNEKVIGRADLVLGLTRAHRGDVVEMWPKAVRHTFTLKEFARLLADVDLSLLPSGDPVGRMRAAIPLAAAQRHQVRSAAIDDVIDPYRQSDETYLQSFNDISLAVDTIIRIVKP